MYDDYPTVIESTVENIRDVIPYPRTPGNCEY